MKQEGSIRRKTAVAVALALSATMCSLPELPTWAAVSERYEFEDGKFADCENNGGIAWTQVDEDADGNPCDMTGWSGEGYAYLDDKGASVTVTVEVAETGYYALKLNYLQCFGKPSKIQYLYVNGTSQGEISFPFNAQTGWTLQDSGYVKLQAGKNDIQIVSYWGFTFLDYLILEPAPAYLSTLSPTPKLSNPNANAETVALYQYLRSVYGNHVLAGQQENCGSHCYNKNAYESTGKPFSYLEDNEKEFDYLQETTGKQPAVRGIDFLMYNTTTTYEDDAPERAIEWYQTYGGIPTVTYHWSVPSEENGTEAAFYVQSANAHYTTFSISKALEEGTWENKKLMDDIAYLAKQFQKLEDAGVPCIFRPLHEAEGAWFWWGAEGAAPCVALYQLLWEQFTNVYHLDNLIWEWTSSTYSTSSAWYPGDAYVDMIGYDKYNAVDYQANLSAIASTFFSLVASTDGEKMVAMSENDTIPALADLMKDGAAWLYFCPWYGNYLTDAALNPVDNLKALYNSEYCITLDELPDWKTYVQSGTTPITGTTTTTEDAGMLGDVNCDSFVDVGDVVLLNRLLAEDTKAVVTEQGIRNADCDFDGKLTAVDATRILRWIAKLLTTEAFQSGT